MKLLKLINPEGVTEEEVAEYRLREAGRAAVIDGGGLIALLHVGKENYYKLPGGGLEGTEEREGALRRECLEEIGCDIEVVRELGLVVEYRKIFSLKQTSYCYLAKVRGEKGESDFTEGEKEKGFSVAWLPYEEALKALSQSKATSFEGSHYIVPREVAILEEAREFI